METTRNGLPYDQDHALRTLAEADPRMGALIATVGPYGINFQPTQDLFEALSRAIVYQQLSGKAAATIYGRLKALTGGDGSFTPRAVQSLAFEDLRGAGLSRAKSLAILDLAEKTLAGAIPPGDHIASLSDAEIMERLTAVRGIGPWTVEMLLMFRLGRPDVLPATDLGVRKGFAMLYGHAETPAPAALLDYGEKWRPYRSVASWYLWRMLELDDGALPPP